MTPIKYKHGAERCPKCKTGEITYGSTITDKLPIGFGFVGHRFQIDTIKRVGFGGECMSCFTKVFAVKSQRHIVTYPKLGKGKGGRR
jgi:hypothetical protein